MPHKPPPGHSAEAAVQEPVGPVWNVIPVGGDPLGDAAVDRMRRYLLEADLVGGYVPQFVHDEGASRLWTAFWFAIRRLDDLVDRHGYAIVERIESLADRLDATVALRAFADAAPVPQVRRRVLEVLRTPEAERRLLAAADEGAPGSEIPSADQLFELWYFKAYAPTYLGLRLWLPEARDEAVRRLAMLAGAAMQWLDDLYDLDDDLAAGKVWLCREELDLLGIDRPAELGDDDRARLTRLREAVCLATFLAAETTAAELPAAEGRRALTFVEAGLRFCQPGQFRIYGRRESAPWVSWQHLLAALPGDEGVRYRLLHGLNDLFVALPLHGSEVRAARDRLARLGGCPEALAPARCLAVMERVEDERERRWHEDSGGELSPLERVLAAPRDPSSPAAPLPVHPPGRARGARSVPEVAACGLDLGRRLVEQTLRQGLRTAGEIRDRRYGPESLSLDLRESAVRALRASLDFGALSFEALVSLTRPRGDR